MSDIVEFEKWRDVECSLFPFRSFCYCWSEIVAVKYSEWIGILWRVVWLITVRDTGVLENIIGWLDRNQKKSDIA